MCSSCHLSSSEGLILEAFSIASTSKGLFLFSIGKASFSFNAWIAICRASSMISSLVIQLEAVTGAKYYLLCDWLDMTPISTSTTDIDEILLVRKAKRINSNIRKSYNTYVGRQRSRTQYTNYLKANPYAPDIFKRFIEHIISQMQNEDLVEESILNIGYF